MNKPGRTALHHPSLLTATQLKPGDGEDIPVAALCARGWHAPFYSVLCPPFGEADGPPGPGSTSSVRDEDSRGDLKTGSLPLAR